MRLVPSTDGVVVAVYDLGGSGPTLVLAHAAGFCGSAFRPLAEHLSAQFRCVAIDFRGHGDAQTPVGIDVRWSGFADDVIAVVTADDTAPVFGFGHSLGGAAMLMAAARRPDLFRSLYCFEPILWPDPEAARSRAERLAEGARRRRAAFATRADAYANYASKPPLSWLDDAALRAYIDHGLRSGEDGMVHLRCPPDVEAKIYLQGAASDGFSQLSRAACPVVVARGTERGALEREIVEAQVAALPDASLEEFEGLSHFAPLEEPSLVGAAVVRAFSP